MSFIDPKKLPLPLVFSLRYFGAKKSIHAITIIARITTLSIAIGTAALLIVLSIFNGFEGLVKDLYAAFYPDVRIVNKHSPIFKVSSIQKEKLGKIQGIAAFSMTLESNALFQYENNRVNLTLKGVDENYDNVCEVPQKIIRGKFSTGLREQPMTVLGSGIANALQIVPEQTLIPITAYLPKKNAEMQANPMESISTFNIYPVGSFAIQQDFDNRYAITNIFSMRSMLGVDLESVSAIEIKLKEKEMEEDIINNLRNIFGSDFLIENRFQQNRTLFGIMQSEKWIIFGILSFILILASFNMVSTLSLLILEKQKDIQILKALGIHEALIRKIFMGESILLAVTGGIMGTSIALIFCWLQQAFHLIPLKGSFVIDYYPVKIMGSDILIVMLTVIAIAIFAGLYPSIKAAKQVFSIKAG
jgi:lipoprotein-releasing system permease protein